MKKYKNNIEQQARAINPCLSKSKEDLEEQLQRFRYYSWDNQKDITRGVRAKARSMFKKHQQQLEFEKEWDAKNEVAKTRLEVAREKFLSKLSNEDKAKYLAAQKRRGEISGNDHKREKSNLNKILKNYHQSLGFNDSIFHYYN